MSNNTNILYFEGAGIDFNIKEHNSDVGNYRIRTVFKNKNGHLIYLECQRGNRYFKNKVISNNTLYVSACFDITKNPDCNQSNLLKPDEQKNIINAFDYTKEHITKWINSKFNANFNSIQVLDFFDGYRVFNNSGTYNIMDYFILNPERTQKRKIAYKYMCKHSKKMRKYPCVCVQEMTENNITFKFPDTDERLKEVNLKRYYTFSTKGKLKIIDAHN